MSQNILTTNTVCVETIHSDSDLEIYSNRKIHFDSPNMLVRELHFNKHIDNVVFGTTPPLTDTSHEYKEDSISQNEIDHLKIIFTHLRYIDFILRNRIFFILM